MVLVGTHANALLGRKAYFQSAVGAGYWNYQSHQANMNTLIPYLKTKRKLNMLNENYVSFTYNNHVFLYNVPVKIAKED